MFSANYNLPLFDEIKNDKKKYEDYRCFTNARTTGPPWFPTENTCPCDESKNNTTGRGYTVCSFGVSKKEKIPSYFAINSNSRESTGSLYNQKQNVPPQLNPNPVIRIGQEWRSVN